MLTYGVIYLGCWSILLHAPAQATETIENNLAKSKIASGSTNSLDVASELSYQPKIQVSIPFFTPRFVRGEDIQLREQLEDMLKEVRGLSSRMQKLEGQDGRPETTSNGDVVDATRCNANPNQSGTVDEDSSGFIAAEMTKLLQSIKGPIYEFRTSLDVVQEKMEFVNKNLNEIVNNPTMPGTEPNTTLHYSHRHIDVSMNTNDTLPNDCWDVFKSGYKVSGVYKIKPAPLNATAFFVYCQMDVHGGGWTVFQNRYDGQVNFYQNWKHYKSGFGNLNGEFWLGLDHIHELTNSKVYELLIELKDFDSQTRFATYDKFLVDSEEKKYQISLLGAYKGNAGKRILREAIGDNGDCELVRTSLILASGNSFAYHERKNFSTWDMDNDSYKKKCAAHEIGAWWFNFCAKSHLNGPYSEGEPATSTAGNGGIFWSELMRIVKCCV